MRTLTSGGSLLIAASLFCCSAVFAGPEIGMFSEQSTQTTLLPESAPAPTDNGIDVEAALAVPAFENHDQASVSSDLNSREQVMIPLPSPLILALIMLAGVATHAVRQQRTTRS